MGGAGARPALVSRPDRPGAALRGDYLNPDRPRSGCLIAGDLIRPVGLLPAQVSGPLGLGSLVTKLLSPLVHLSELFHIEAHQWHAHDAPAELAAPLVDLTGLAGVAGTGTIASARNATPPRPSMFHGVATSLSTVTSCRLTTFGSPAVVTLMTSAPVSSIATSSVTCNGAPVSRSVFCRPSLSFLCCGARETTNSIPSVLSSNCI